MLCTTNLRLDYDGCTFPVCYSAQRKDLIQAVIDRRTLINGSFNWTAQAAAGIALSETSATAIGICYLCAGHERESRGCDHLPWLDAAGAVGKFSLCFLYEVQVTSGNWWLGPSR